MSDDGGTYVPSIVQCRPHGAIVPRRLRWLWPGRVPRRAITMLDGDPGTGKSMMAADLAVRVAGGHTMPDGNGWDGAGVGAPVLYIGLDEASEIGAVPRIDAAGGDDTRRIFHWPGDVPCTMPDDVEKVRDTVMHLGAALVIVDTLVRTAASLLKLENYQDATQVLGAWEAVAAQTGASILCLNHRTKVAHGDAMGRGYGSLGGIAGVARSMLGVSRDHGTAPGEAVRFYLDASKASYSTIAERLAYRIVPAVVAGVGDDGRTCEVHTARIDWLPEVRAVSAGERRNRERDAIASDEDAIARRALGNGFEGTAEELTARIVEAGVPVGRADIARRRIAISVRAQGGRNRYRWLPRTAGPTTANDAVHREGENGDATGLDDVPYFTPNGFAHALAT